MQTLRDIIGNKYSLNHLNRVSIKSPTTLDDKAILEVTLSYASEGLDKGKFTIKMPITLENK